MIDKRHPCPGASGGIWHRLLNADLGHEYMIFSGGAMEMVGCARCCCTINARAEKLQNKCIGRPTSASQAQWWNQMVATGRHRNTGDNIGDPVRLNVFLRMIADDQTNYLADEFAEEQDAGDVLG